MEVIKTNKHSIVHRALHILQYKFVLIRTQFTVQTTTSETNYKTYESMAIDKLFERTIVNLIEQQ